MGGWLPCPSIFEVHFAVPLRRPSEALPSLLKMLSSAARFQRSVLANSQQVSQKSANKSSSVGSRSLKPTGSNKRRIVASSAASHTYALLSSSYSTHVPSVTAIKSGSSRNRNHFHFAYSASHTAPHSNTPCGNESTLLCD